MNIYHRYLKIPFDFKNPFHFNETSNRPYIMHVDRSYVDKKFINWMLQFPVKVSNVIEVFYTPAMGGALPIHSDSGPICNNTKLNFTWGPKSSVTRWWKIKDIKFLQIIEAPFKYPFIVSDFGTDLAGTAEEKDCDQVFEQVIDRPSLMNVGQLHSTYNPGNEARYTLSFTLLNADNTNVTFEKSCEVFSKVIDEY